MNRVIMKEARNIRVICKGLTRYYAAFGSDIESLIASAKGLTKQQTLELNELLVNARHLIHDDGQGDAKRYSELAKKMARDVGHDTRPAILTWLLGVTLYVGFITAVCYLRGDYSQYATQIKMGLIPLVLFGIANAFQHWLKMPSRIKATYTKNRSTGTAAPKASTSDNKRRADKQYERFLKENEEAYIRNLMNNGDVTKFYQFRLDLTPLPEKEGVTRFDKGVES